jgi:hypothetical protein
MLRKLMLVAVAAAAPIGLIAVAGTAGATKTPPVNATNNTVSCTTIKGTVTFVPPVTSSETAGSSSTKIKATVTGCTSNAGGLTVTSGAAAGTLTDSRTTGEDGCTALAGGSSATGPITIKWKTSPKLSSGSSVIHVNSEAGGVGGDGNATFQIPGTTPNGTPSGSFQGTDAGSGDLASAQTTTSALSILGTCDSKGLKTIHIETPQSGNSLNLS